MHVRYGQSGALTIEKASDAGTTTREEQMITPQPHSDPTDVAQRVHAAEEELRRAEATRPSVADRSTLLLQNERLRSALSDLVHLSKELACQLRERQRSRGDQR